MDQKVPRECRKGASRLPLSPRTDQEAAKRHHAVTQRLNRSLSAAALFSLNLSLTLTRGSEKIDKKVPSERREGAKFRPTSPR